MNETISCPNCNAELVLPVVPAGQTVQCPRCQRIFELALKRTKVPASSTRPIVRDAADEEPLSIAPNVLRFQPLTGGWKANCAIVFLALTAVSYVLQTYIECERGLIAQLEGEVFGGNRIFNLKQRPMFHRNRDPREEVVARRQDSLRSLSEKATVLHALTCWLATLFVLIWTYHAATSLRILQCGGLKFSPALATFSYFIPLGNCFLPYMGVQEIWRASEPNATGDPQAWRSGPRSRLVILWWLVLLAGMGTSFIARTFGVHPWSTEERVRQANFACMSSVCMLAASVMLIAVIRSVTVRQRARHAKIYDDVGD